MIGGVRRALRRGTVAGSLVLGITAGVGLVDATQALASSGYTISRYAGIENSAGGATAGPALSSHLSFGVADGLDSAGNLYIVDPNNVAVEKSPPPAPSRSSPAPARAGPPYPDRRPARP